MVLKVKYSGEDNWGRKTYQIIGSRRYLKIVDGKFHYSTAYGEPDTQVHQEVKIIKRRGGGSADEEIYFVNREDPKMQS
jgi:hypothetical protein